MEEVERLARELATRRGQSVSDVLLDALRREQATARVPAVETMGLATALLAIGERYGALPTLDDRSDEEVLGYGYDDAEQTH